MKSVNCLARCRHLGARPQDAHTAWLGLLAAALLAIAGLALSARPAAAGGPTLVGGSITAPTTWLAADSPYIVTQTVTIEGSGALTLEPGVEVRFRAGTGLHVRSGPLLIQGTVAKQVLLTADADTPSPGFWNGISAEGTSQPNSLGYCVVEYADIAFYAQDSDRHTINHCILRHNDESAIHVEGDWLTVTDSEIHDNGLGVRLRKSFYDVLTGNQIHDNAGFGIGFLGDQGPGGGNNLIYNNDLSANGGDGLRLDDGYNNLVTENRIADNGGHGLWTRSQVNLTLTRNVVVGNGQNGLTYANPNFAPAALHSNVLCGNADFEIANLWPTTLPAEGNWYGTNTPDATHIAGPADVSPWITLGAAVSSDRLPADGSSTANLTLTLHDGAGHTVPDGYTAQVSANRGSLEPPTVAFANGQAASTYRAGTVPGPVDLQFQDSCAAFPFPAILALEAVDLSVHKAGPGGMARPGGLVTYTIGFSETNGVDARHLRLVDDLPAGATWVRDTSAACGLARQQTSPDVVWAKNLWAGGGDCLFQITVRVDDQACAQNRLINTVSVSSDAADKDLTNNSWITAGDSPLITCIDLAVTKDAGAGLVPVLQPQKAYLITYTLTYTNEGYIPAAGVWLTDSLPANTELVAAAGWICQAGQCTHQIGALPAGKRRLAPPLVVRVTARALSGCGSLTNNAAIGDNGSHGPDLDPPDNSAHLATALPCLPDLVLTKSGADTYPVRPGERITYTLAYENVGLADAAGVILTETLPAHTAVAGTGWTCAGGSCIHHLGALARGAQGQTLFVAQVSPSAPEGAITNTAQIGSMDGDIDPRDNLAQHGILIGPSPVDLQVHKTHSGLLVGPSKNYSIHYTITITNSGQITASGVVVTDLLPDATMYNGGDWLCVGNRCSFAVGDLPPATRLQIPLPLRLEKSLVHCPLVLTNTVEISDNGAHGDRNPADNTFVQATAFDCQPDLAVILSDNVGPLGAAAQVSRLGGFDLPQRAEPLLCTTPGGWITYTIAYANTGLSAATQAILTADIPDHTRYIGPGWSCAGETCTRSLGTIAPGAGGVANLAVQVVTAPPEWQIAAQVRIDSAEVDYYPADNLASEQAPICHHFSHLPIAAKGFPPYEPPEPPGIDYVAGVAVNPATNRVYVSSPVQNALLAVDPAGDGAVVAAIPVGTHPLGVAAVPTTNKIYVANLNSWTVTSVRGSDHSRITDLFVGAQACRVVADPQDARVYVTNLLATANGVAAIDSRNDAFEYYYSQLNALQGRYGLDVDTVADKLFITARDAGLIAIQDAYRPSQEPALIRLDPNRLPYMVAFNPATNHLFVTAADDNLVVVLDPHQIRWQASNWLTWQKRQVFLLGRDNPGWIKEIGIGEGAEEGIAVNPATGHVYITNAESDTVSIIQDDADPDKIQWVTDLAVGSHPQGVGVDPEANLIYVGNAWSRDLTVIDGSTNTVVKTIPLY